jgi:hypothetical protein
VHDAISNAGLITEHILKPVHEAVAMHAHPHISQGKLVSMSPNPFIRIVGGLLSCLMLFLILPWLCIPLIGWARGKTLSAWWFGYHYEDKNGKTNPGGSVLNPLLIKLNLLTLVTTFVVPIFLSIALVQYAHNIYAPSPTDRMDFDYTKKLDAYESAHVNAMDIGKYFTGIWVIVMLFSSLICLQFSERNQTIWEYWCGAYPVVDI